MTIANLITILIAASVTFLFNIILYLFTPFIERKYKFYKLQFQFEESHGNYIRISLKNFGFWTVHRVKAYITIDHSIDDVIPPEDSDSFITPSNYKSIKESQLCWAYRTSEQTNPPEIDIFSHEKVDINLCKCNEEKLVVPSEEGWNKTKRAFLKNKNYCCNLKIVSEDTESKNISFIVDSYNKTLVFV